MTILSLMSQILWAFELGELLYREDEGVVTNEESVILAMDWVAHSEQLTTAGAVVPPILTLAGFRVCLLSAHSLPAPSADYRISTISTIRLYLTILLRRLDDILRRYEKFLHLMTF